VKARLAEPPMSRQFPRTLVSDQLLAEAVVLGQKAGLDRHRLLDVLSKTPSSRLHIPGSCKQLTSMTTALSSESG
jgi:3-hydroxyisobutyrate dehydrogenase-like beta-hydroxyacid dehydrogenase